MFKEPPVQFPAISVIPKTRMLVLASPKQIFFGHHPAVHVFGTFGFAAWGAGIALFLKITDVLPYLLLALGFVIFYIVMHFISGKRRRITLDDTGVIVKTFFGEFKFPFDSTNKVILVKNLTFVTGRGPTRFHDGMQLLFFTTRGVIPGFPTAVIAHEVYFKPEDLVAIFNAFDPQDRIQFEQATRSDILAWCMKQLSQLNQPVMTKTSK